MRDQHQVIVEAVVSLVPFQDQAAHLCPRIPQILTDIQGLLGLHLELRQGQPREALTLRIFRPRGEELRPYPR